MPRRRRLSPVACCSPYSASRFRPWRSTCRPRRPNRSGWPRVRAVPVLDFPAKGLILDIGGGGWGVIGQLKGKQVVSIDISPQELVEAPPGPLLKIIMDARQLLFLDDTFPTVTVFFTFMFMAPADHEKVFRELYRVTEPGGRLLIWDVVFPRLTDLKKKFATVPVTVKLPGKEIDAGYSTYLVPAARGCRTSRPWPRRSGSPSSTKELPRTGSTWSSPSRCRADRSPAHEAPLSEHAPQDGGPGGSGRGPGGRGSLVTLHPAMRRRLFLYRCDDRHRTPFQRT